jgi:hypothetical protein
MTSEDNLKIEYVKRQNMCLRDLELNLSQKIRLSRWQDLEVQF